METLLIVGVGVLVGAVLGGVGTAIALLASGEKLWQGKLGVLLG